jgi:mycothiol synthase
MPTQINPNSILEQGFQIRACTADDLKEVYAVFNEYWKVLAGSSPISLGDLQSIFSTPGFSPESSTRVVVSSQGQIVAGVLVIDLASPPVHPYVYGCVHADFEGKGLGTRLIQWAEERARQAIDRVPEGARVSMYLQTSSTHEPTIRLFEKLGLSSVRYSWRMLRELDETPPAPVWPEGIHVQTYQDRPDLKAALRATDEAFQDHWGYVDREDEEAWFERVRHAIESDEAFDPTLWFLAMDGDEIAAVSRCNPRSGDDWQTGEVETLGVRRPWRRQGLGLALLHHAFGEFHRRGYKRVDLGVDTASLTGATRLYEKAGMRVIHEFVAYEKELWPGQELSKQQAQA